MNKTLKLFIAIIVCELAGIVGSVFTASAIPTWYATLAKPALNPPGWLFGPVWTTLYALMGIALFLVWKNGLAHKGVRWSLSIFGLQLFLNATWSIVFFGLQSPAWAFANIIALWVAIVWTMILFYRLSRPAMWLLVPYIAWVSFAGYLNYSIWILNM
jgi:tryptophan-rich sensory protein